MPNRAPEQRSLDASSRQRQRTLTGAAVQSCAVRRGLLAAVALLCIVAGAPAAQVATASSELALEGEPTLGDSWGGVAVWSHWNSGSHRYELVQWRAGVT